MNTDAHAKQNHDQFRQKILSTILAATAGVTFLLLCASPFLSIPKEGNISVFFIFIYSVCTRVFIQKFSYKISASIFLAFLFILLPLNQLLTPETAHASSRWYCLLPIAFIFFLGKEFALIASISIGLFAAFMDIVINLTGNFTVSSISRSMIVDASFHAISIFLCGLIPYYFEKYRENSEASIRAAKNQLDGILGNSPGIVYQFSANTEGDADFSYVSDQIQKLYETSPQHSFSNHDLMQTVLQEQSLDNIKSMIILRVASYLMPPYLSC